ncbi:GroES-like protein [Macroventuria anomochaeta]|uniref:GroES-like protein n=1 Tax=Macroventuria anomochaeta TaxID=301207 RepID=A0ACB6SHT6_9PLEO|nr:GroES-like protein [Macroventuria anomochaeta]KAF2633845.1 GroES-like protein [Macroventuria anomochaeta]
MSSVPKTMKAARLTRHTVPVPEYGDNDLLLKVGAAGFCHTDYQVYEGVYQSKLPLTPSHEPKVGQRVGMLNLKHACNSCGGCRNYREGDPPNMRFCENKEMAGVQHDGGFAEYVVADAGSSSLLPDGLSSEQAAPMMCAGVIGVIEKDLPVAVIGVGGLGQRPSKGRDLAQEVGPENLRADKVINYNNKDATEQVIKFGGDAGGVAGVCVPLGLPPDGFKFGAIDLVFKERVIRGSLVATKPLTDEMFKLVDKHGVRSHLTTIGFKDVPKLPEVYMNEHLKCRLVLKM